MQPRMAGTLRPEWQCRFGDGGPVERTGLAFLAVFGLVWWLAGVTVLGEALWPVAVPAGLALAAGVWRTGRGLPKTGRAPVLGDVRRRFTWINVLQWLAIALAAACARAGDVPELIPGLVAVIVGLHFLPLAVLFRRRRFHLTGAMLIAVGTAGCVIGIAGAAASTVQATVGLGAAIILWGTASLGPRGETGTTERPGTQEHSATP
jgi:hypothetical protein